MTGSSDGHLTKLGAKTIATLAADIFVIGWLAVSAIIFKNWMINRVTLRLISFN